jgi:signal transduction histidine kinase
VNVSPVGAHPGDATLRDLLSSLTALQVLSMVMAESKDDDEILELAVSALQSLTHRCRAEAVWLDGQWRSLGSLPGRPVGGVASLEAQLAGLGSAGGALQMPHLGWAWAFALSSRGGASGYVVVGSPQSPPEHEWSLIQALAQQTGVALANARLLAGERAARAQIADEQATLRRVAALVTRAVPPEEVFTAVAAEAGRSRDADIAVMSRYNEEGTATVVGAWVASDGDPPFHVGTRLEDAQKSLHSLVFKTGQPARTDFSDASGPFADAAREYGMRSAVGAPIHIEGRIWGVMALASRHEEPLPSDTEAWLAAFTELVATAIAHAQARVELRGHADEQAALRRVATLVASGSSPAEVVEVVSMEVGQLLPADAAGVGRFKPDGSGIALGGWSRASTYRIPVGTEFALEPGLTSTLVFETGRPGRIDSYDGATGPLAASARAEGWRSAVTSPITVEGRLWGFVFVASRSDRRFPSDTEARLANFTDLVATAIANAEGRSEIARLAEEQAALRRVAMLVARGAPPEQVFSGVAREISNVLGVRAVTIDRYDPDGSSTVVASLHDPAFPVGSRWPLDGPSLGATVLRTRRPARLDDYTDLQSTVAAVAREHEVTSTVGVPILVEGAVWGVICVGVYEPEPLPTDTEERLAAFTELLETAISNAHSRAELVASRARVVAAGDETRRRIERDLHDGIQQRLVSLGLDLQAARASVRPGLHELDNALSRISEGLSEAFEELREISHGIHPAVLSEGGLRAALSGLRRRSAVPVEVDLHAMQRLPEAVEVAAYYLVSEALTNTAKYADASVVSVDLDAADSTFRLAIRDDGVGGADPSRGSGLVGLRDRVEALGGTLEVTSSPGSGTTLLANIPLDRDREPRSAGP